MITKPTLFVLGAGASIPYGFPSGYDLRKEICESSRGRATRLVKLLEINCKVSPNDVVDFATCFMQSRIASIDSFLSRRPEFSYMGKAAIAALLIPKETEAQFDAEIVDDWYFALWNALVSDVSELKQLADNKIQIITFNYDRSLERYLHTAIRNTFSNVSDEDALEALAYFNIKHVYGSLGKYGLENNRDTRTYTAKLNDLTLDVAVRSLKVIPEAREDDSIFNEAREAFKWAEHVCFLGFGFDHLNVKRLGFKDIVHTRNELIVPSRVIASTFGKTKAEETIAKNSLIGGIQFFGKDGAQRPTWSTHHGINLETLREHAWLLR